MSSTTVCHQGLQTCLDPLVRLKLTPPKTNFPSISGWDYSSDPPENFQTEKTVTESSTDNLNSINIKDSNNTKAETAGWSFIQSLDNPKTQTTKTEEVYVHPLAKRSASVLSPRSLAMCTESLGSETGSEHGGDCFALLLQSNVDIPLVSLESNGKTNPTCDITTSDNNVQAPPPKRVNRSTTFPPPLTSISGSSGVQVRPHREGGRLVLKAVTVVSPPTAYFEAERGDGRLRLRLLKDISTNSDIEEVAEDDCERELAAAEEEELVDVEEDEVQIENEIETGEVDENRGVGETEEMQGNSGKCVEKEDMEGDSGNLGGEKGMGKIPRPSRCKEGGRGNKKMVMHWPESFWVAI